MGKQWVKQEIKKNELAAAGQKMTGWLQSNRQTALATGGAVLFFAGVAGILIFQNVRDRRMAFERLAIAQSMAAQGQVDRAVEELKNLADMYPRADAAGFAILSAGDIRFRQQHFKEAQEFYQRILDAQTPRNLIPFALWDLGITQEAAGQLKEAIETDQKFLDSYQDHFLAPQVHGSLARCYEAAGQHDQAKSAYERMALLYPDTYWAQWAQARLNPVKAPAPPAAAINKVAPPNAVKVPLTTPTKKAASPTGKPTQPDTKQK